MINQDFIHSLKKLVKDEDSALVAHRDMMNNRYNVTSSNYNGSSSSESSGNIQEIGHEIIEDDEFSL